MRLRLSVGICALVLGLFAFSPLGAQGSLTERAGSIRSKLDTTRSKIKRTRGREQVLTTTISGYSRRIGALQSDVDRLQQHQDTIQADLDAKRAELARIQADLRRARAELARLKAKLAESRATLAVRLRALYQGDAPDIVTVILNAKGYADLLERAEFLRRINDQNQRIVVRVKRDKASTARAAVRLDRVEARQQRLTAAVLARRNQAATVKQRVVDKRAGFESLRSERSGLLASVQTSRRELESEAAALEKEQAKVEAKLRAAQRASGSPSSPSAGPVRRGSGSLIWPINGTITGVFGEWRGDHAHSGLDIAAPNGTPIRAADSGSVVIAGWTGGYGQYTCIQHTGTMSTCYAHQSRIDVSVGRNVSQGETIGAVGNTGHSFGDHLHFEVRINGSAVDPTGYL